MESTMAAIEMTGTIDKHRQLRLDDSLPVPGPMRVRVIVLYPSSGEADVADVDHASTRPSEDEAEWLQAAARNPAFAVLKEPEEDIYSPTDGKPFHDEV